MSRGINKVILVGNLGRDPETRYSASGSAITNLNLATSESWTDNTGNRQDRTEWHRVVMFGKLAEIAHQYLHKGSKVYVEGSLRTSQYEKDGITRYSTDIIAREMSMLDSRQEQQDAPSYNQNYAPQQSQQQSQQPSSQQAPARKQHTEPANHNPPAATQNPQDNPPPAFDQFDDDIPF